MRAFIEGLLASPHLADQIVFRHEISDGPARYQDLTRPLSLQQQAGAARLGVDRLYSHQAEAIEQVRAGRDVAVVTPTASGKSLIYYLPTVESLGRGDGHALYLFPQKALEQDQLVKLRVFGRGLFGDRDLSVDIYDGDTPPLRRRKIRASPPDILITNPEMLHLGLLAYHNEWAGFFRSLRLVVIDELHVYRGVFGNHFAHVLRRLERITRHYGADPRYLVGSATVGNPETFTRALLGRDFHVVSESGSPRAARHFLFLNPTGSPYTTATRLFTDAVRAGYRTIAFTKARRVTELMHSWAAQAGPDVARRIAPYRAGYLPEERREIERRLFRGDLRGVVATSALELGIDVGGLDVCILVGYPGSVMSSWQRIGRVGRASGESLVILVAQPDALDQYFMTHPRAFFERGFEPAIVDPTNPAVAGAHLVCAGAELPVPRAEAEATLGADGLAEMLGAGRLLEDDEGENVYSLNRRPHREVNLRSGGASFKIVTHEEGRAIGTIDGVRVFHECHEGAVYLHGGTTYRIVRLDEESKRVVAVPFFGDHYTQALGSKETEILETLRETEKPGYRLSFGRLKVTVRITEYAKKRISDQETISRHPLDVPPIVFETVGFWMTLPEEIEPPLVEEGLHVMGGLHGAEHAMISLFPLLALCDRSDVGGISYSRNPQLGAPAIFIYDGYPGGIGLAACVHDRIEELFSATRELLESCPCDEGCPSCVQSPKCGSGNRPLDKRAALRVLEHLSGAALFDEPVHASAPRTPDAPLGNAASGGVPGTDVGRAHPAPLPAEADASSRPDRVGAATRVGRFADDTIDENDDRVNAGRDRADAIAGREPRALARARDLAGSWPAPPASGPAERDLHGAGSGDGSPASAASVSARRTMHAEVITPVSRPEPGPAGRVETVPAARTASVAPSGARPAPPPGFDPRGEHAALDGAGRSARPTQASPAPDFSSFPEPRENGPLARNSLLARAWMTLKTFAFPRSTSPSRAEGRKPETREVPFAPEPHRAAPVEPDARSSEAPRPPRMPSAATIAASAELTSASRAPSVDPSIRTRRIRVSSEEDDESDPLSRARFRAFVAASGAAEPHLTTPEDPAAELTPSDASRPQASTPDPLAVPSDGFAPAPAPRPQAPPRPPILLQLRPGEGRTLVFDVETQRSAEDVGGWDRIRDMGLALAVVFDVGSGAWTTYFEKDVERLVMDLVTADRVIGYNSERFDLAVLSGYGRWDLSRVRSFDMMRDLKRRLGFRPKLGDLAQVNLNAGKSADGLQSLEWYKQGRMDLIEEYCRRDVEVTAQLFFGSRARRYILIRHHLGAAVRLPVDW